MTKYLRIGPLRKYWPKDEPKGDCKHYKGECDGTDCGLHKAGCIYGGFTSQTSYWLIAEGCPLYHGEKE